MPRDFYLLSLYRFGVQLLTNGYACENNHDNNNNHNINDDDDNNSGGNCLLKRLKHII